MKVTGAGFFQDPRIHPTKGLELGQPILALNYPANPKQFIRLPKFALVLFLCDGKPGPFTLMGRLNGPSGSTSEVAKHTYEWPERAKSFSLRHDLEILLEFKGPGSYSLALLADAEPLVELALPLIFEGDE